VARRARAQHRQRQHRPQHRRGRLPGADGHRQDGGVDVGGIAVSDPEGRLEYAPDHSLADEDGYVRAPEMDMASQMSQLVMAQRGYQASVGVTKNAQDTYSSALQIGRG
jgi:flagellar basal-body rod protein FlgC